MRCPFCGHEDTQVRDSRQSDDGRSIRRRRVCSKCDKRFTTFERYQTQQAVVVKRDGHRELFDREKLARSLSMALRKRPVPVEDLGSIAIEIENALLSNGATEIRSQQLGHEVLKRLKKLDFVGYVRYASVYNEFGGPDDFQELVDAARED